MPNRTKSEIAGQRFGKLVAISDTGKRNKKRCVIWLCKCDCGNTLEAASTYLKRGVTKSCGCLGPEVASSMAKHGHSRSGAITREYNSWMSMKHRCLNPNCKEYPDYGGRGIGISSRWLGVNGFENFLADMGPRPEGTTLDRWPNNETGHYGPDNCRWGTQDQQKRNTRRNVWLEFAGIKMVKEDWGKRWGIHPNSIQCHLDSGKSFEFIYNRFEIGVKSGIVELGKAKKPIICVNNNKEYDSIKSASIELNVSSKNISTVLHGRRKKAGGYAFIFK